MVKILVKNHTNSITNIILITTLFISGCAVSYEKAKQKISLAKPCCDDYSEFNYEEIPLDKPLIFDLKETSPAFNFSSGKSFFKALRLPSHPLPYTIKIRSYAEGMVPTESHIFYPKLLILREDFSVESEVIPELILERDDLAALKENTLSRGNLGIRLSGEISITSPEQRYLLIYTTEELLSYSYGAFLYMGVFAYIPFTASEGFYDIPLSPIGRIVVEVKSF